MPDEELEFEGHLVHETEAAWLFHVDDEGEEIWFPKSVCDLDSSQTSLLCPLWLAKEKGIV